MATKPMGDAIKSLKEQMDDRAVKNILAETDPQKIIELAKPHSSEKSFGDPFGVEVTGHKEKLAAVKNSKTPTIFLLYLYHYPKDKQKESGATDYQIGPGSNTGHAPYVTNEIRNAARDALTSRNWQLTPWEHMNLSLEKVRFFERQLDNDKLSFALRSSKSKTPLNEISNELIGILRKNK